MKTWVNPISLQAPLKPKQLKVTTINNHDDRGRVTVYIFGKPKNSKVGIDCNQFVSTLCTQVAISSERMNKSVVHVPSIDEIEALDEQEEKQEHTSGIQILESWRKTRDQFGKNEEFQEPKAKNVNVSKIPPRRPIIKSSPPTPTSISTSSSPKTHTTQSSMQYVKEIKTDNCDETSVTDDKNRDDDDCIVTSEHLNKTKTSTKSIYHSQPIPNDNLTVYVNKGQQGNPILKHIKQVKIQYWDNMLPDYIMSKGTCAFYLSLRFHTQHPNYLSERIKKIRNLFPLRVVICQIDVNDNYESPIQDVTKVCLWGSCTLILSFSTVESSRYLELYKIYERKSARTIQTKIEESYFPRAQDALTSIRSVNKTDVVTLLNNFGSMKNILGASLEELSLCPGIGEKKVKRLYDTFRTPFLPSNNKEKPKKQTSLDAYFSSQVSK